MHELNIVACNIFIHVVCNNLRICGNNRTVVVVRLILILIPLIVDAWIEDEFLSVVNKPSHVSVNQLGRITCRIRWNSIHSQLVNRFSGLRGQYDPVSKICPEGKPEWVVFIYVKNSRNTYGAPRRVLFLKRLVFKESPVLVLVEVRNVVCLFCLSFPLLASVSSNELRSVCKFVYGEKTAVFAAFAPCCGGFHIEAVKLFSL